MSQNVLPKRFLPAPDFWQGMREAAKGLWHLGRLLRQFKQIDERTAQLKLAPTPTNRRVRYVGLKDGFKIEGTDFMVPNEDGFIRRVPALQVIDIIDKYDGGQGGTGPI